VWEIVSEEWDSVTANDLHQFFGIDVGDESTLDRPWWWLRSRIEGILDVPESRLIRRLAAREAREAAAKERDTRASG
jgi:hypothetical protein